MSSEHLLEAEPPQPYAFNNWDDFLRSALIYHSKIHPNDQLVSDRIATLRGLMTERVQTYLGSFVLQHPRYQTTEGWDHWSESVRNLLKPWDSTITSHPVTLEGWLSAFKKGDMRDMQLWRGLDKLVVYGDISSAEQRQYFWDAHSWEAQDRLLKQCPYFDPNDEVWLAHEPGVLEKAEQRLAQVIEFSRIDDELATSLVASNRLTVAAISCVVVFCVLVLLGFKGARDGNDNLMILSFPFAALPFAGFILALINGSEVWKTTGNLRRRQAELSSVL